MRRAQSRAACVAVRLLPHDADRLVQEARRRSVTVSKVVRDALLEVGLVDDDVAGDLPPGTLLDVAS